MKRPALWMVLAFAAGIAVAEARPCASISLLAIGAASAIVLGLALLGLRQLIVSWILSLVAWAALGGLAARISQLPLPANHVTRLIAERQFDTTEPLRWRGKLRSDPLRLPWGLRYEIDLDEVEASGRALAVIGGLRVSYFRNPKNLEEPPALRAGDRVEALVRARRPRNYLNPGAFNVREFLARQRIDLTGSLRSVALLQKLSTPPLTLSSRFARLRGRLLDRVDTLFGGALERATVLRAMLLGDRSFVDSALATMLQKTAAYHVLVVAGLHVAALAMFVFWLGRRLRIPLRVTTLATLLILAFYLGVVEDRPPILRAALMAAVFLCARLLFRHVELLNTVALAALILLFARPSALTDASFQLSFLAAGIIAGLALPWIERSSAPYRAGLAHVGDVTRDGAHPPKVAQFRIDLRAAARWLEARLPARLGSHAPGLVTAPLGAALRLWEVAVLSAAIQLGMVPLLATYFHRVSLAGPLSNVPAVLLTGLIIPFGFLTLAASFAWGRLGALLARPMSGLVGALLASVEWFSRLPRGSYRIPGPPVWLLVAFFAVLVILGTFARWRLQRQDSLPRVGEWLAAAALITLVALIAIYPFAPRLDRGMLETTVLDVGQGDSIFTAFPDGHTMLIDGGGQFFGERVGGYNTASAVGEEVVSPYLWQRGLKGLGVVALTHAHRDHLEGLNAVLKNFHVGELWVGRDVDSAAFRELLALARARGTRIVPHRAGDAFTWDGVTGRILWPEDNAEVPVAGNNDSLVMRLEDGSERFLLPGDIERSVEERLMTERALLSAQFLKVPHHGSKTSSTAEFLSVVAPQVAVISVGEANPFGHPSPGVVERYEADRIRLLRTDRDGAVTAMTDGHRLTVKTYVENIPARAQYSASLEAGNRLRRVAASVDAGCTMPPERRRDSLAS